MYQPGWIIYVCKAHCNRLHWASVYPTFLNSLQLEKKILSGSESFHVWFQSFRVLSTRSKRILGENPGLSHAEGLLIELHGRLRVEVSIMQSETGPPTPSIWDGDSNKLCCLRGSHSLQKVVFFWMSDSCSGHIAAPQCIVIPERGCSGFLLSLCFIFDYHIHPLVILQ